MEQQPKASMSEDELRRLAELRLANLAKGRAKLAEKRATRGRPPKNAIAETATEPTTEPTTDDPIYQNQPVAMPEPQQLPPQSQQQFHEAPVSQPIEVPRQQQRQPKQERDYKQEYYKQKLALLQKQQADALSTQQVQLQQQQMMQSYAQMPPYNHAVDIARNSLRKKADDAMLKKVWTDLFH
jgi:hypothetical protein